MSQNIDYRTNSGDTKEEFARLYDYIKELKISNKDNKIELDALNNVYKRIYIYFKIMRVGFITGYRLVISLDGYFLKGPL